MADFFAALCCATLVALTTRNTALIATSVVLLGNWIVNSAICKVTGIDYPFVAFMLVDYLSGLTVGLIVSLWLYRAPNRWQLLVTSVYAMQVVWHVCYMWSTQGEWIRYASWHFLSKTAWFQLLAVGAWCVAELCNNVLWSDGRVSSDQGLRNSFCEAKEGHRR